MRVLVACEFSGIVRDAFIARGHDALSCDLLPSESNAGPHIQGDVRPLLREKWDMILAHSPCTRKALSGVQWLAKRNLWDDLREECDLFNAIGNADCPRISRENSQPHRYAVALVGKYSQIVHPWQHGHGEQKKICLWLKGLPTLEPTNIVSGREQKVWRMGPSPQRAKERSRFFSGVAAAMADQWGNL